ncbi:MAG: hypothetical protein WKF86_02355 [Acidimicrobiales bacterium]
MIGDQVLASAQSFAISLVVTHAVDLPGIGAFAIAFTAYQLLMAVNRPLNTDPLTVGFAASDLTTQRPAAAAATGGALVLGVVAALGSVGAGWILGGTIGPVLVAFGLCIPPFLVQDAWRCVFATYGRPMHSCVNDAVVLAALAPACWVATKIAPDSAAGLVAAWGAATAIGAVLGGFQAGARPAVDEAFRWWRATLHLGGRMLGENVLALAAYSFGLLAIAVAAGVQELGRLRTAQVSLGAVSPVIIALSTIVAAEGTRLLARSPDRFPQLIRVAAAGSALLTVGFVAFWALAPLVVGRTLIGSSWDAARPLVLATGAFVAAAGVTLAGSGGLRALRRPGGALRARSIAAPVTLAGGVTGALFGGAGPAMLGIAAGEWLCALLTMLAYRAAWRSWRARPWAVGPLAMAGVERLAPT